MTDKPLSTMRCDSFSPQSAQGRTDKVALGHYEKAFVTSYCWCAYVWKRITALVRKYKNTKPTRSTRSTESYGTPNTLWRSRRPLLKGRTCSSFLAYDWVSPDPAVCCSNSSRELRHRSTALRVVCSWGPGALLVRKRFPELAARVFCCKLKSYVELIRLRRARALYPPLDGEGFRGYPLDGERFREYRSTALRVVGRWGSELLDRKWVPELSAQDFCCKLKSYKIVRLR